MEKSTKKPFNVADVLQSLFENSKSPLSSGFQRWKLEAQWSKIVGTTLAAHCRPVNYQKGALVIEVASSVWLNEIRFLTEDIKTKVNDHMGSQWVNKIVLIHK